MWENSYLVFIVPNKYNDKNIALHINPEGDTTTIRIHI